MTSQYAVGDWASLWASEPFLMHRLVLDLQSKRVIAGQDRYRRRRTPMSVADLAYAQQILDETFDDIWTSPADYEFERENAIPAWALEAWTWPRENPGEGEHDTGELGDESCKRTDDESLQVDEYGCRVSVSPVLLSYKGELD